MTRFALWLARNDAKVTNALAAVLIPAIVVLAALAWAGQPMGQ